PGSAAEDSGPSALNLKYSGQQHVMPKSSSKSSLSAKSFVTASSHLKDSAEDVKLRKSSLYEELASKASVILTRTL
ncbi:hypothetical protein MTO96_043181, partial [Rhipicephalus appendiculatus]